MTINKEILLKKLTGALKDGIQVIDRDGVTILYNRKMEIIENRQARDLVGKPLEQLPGLNANDRELLRVLKTGLPRVNLISSGVNVYGNQVTISNSVWPISDKGKTVGAVEIAVDITELRRLHQMILGITKDINQLTQRDVKRKGKNQYHISDIIGESQKMKQVKHVAQLAGKCDANVMIAGASGTGKELVAQSIHNASSRQRKPLIAENCAAIPENLLESTLFGTVKGGFTGAVDRPGLFRLADGGTLVLDEINSLPVGLQAKLLRVLQEGSFRPVGGGDLVEVDVRVIAITNQDPELLIQQGRLREDLFYRLSVIDIFIPSLLEREEDIDLLTGHFLEQFSQKNGKTLAGFSPEVLDAFRSYPWKGNVRELSNVVECGVSMAEDKAVIQLFHLPYYFAKHFQSRSASAVTSSWDIAASGIPGSLNLAEYLSELEQSLIRNAMNQSDGNVSRAAERLGITRQGLQHKLRKMGI